MHSLYLHMNDHTKVSLTPTYQQKKVKEALITTYHQKTDIKSVEGEARVDLAICYYAWRGGNVVLLKLALQSCQVLSTVL